MEQRDGAIGHHPGDKYVAWTEPHRVIDMGNGLLGASRETQGPAEKVTRHDIVGIESDCRLCRPDLRPPNLAIVNYTGEVNELVLASQDANWASKYCPVAGLDTSSLREQTMCERPSEE